MRFGIVVFPGSNCDHDAYHAVHHVLGQPAEFLWHKDRDLKGVDAVILPGGFAYGDYLRCGAMASLSPVMDEVRAFAKKGGPVLGICNGFQVLLETHLLPGAMLRNRSLRFVSKDVLLKVENRSTRFTRTVRVDNGPLRMPVAHAEGNYFLDEEGLSRLEGEGRVVFRYVDEKGTQTEDANPNGALHNIAGIINEGGNVLGLMPHPERACESVLGSRDGLGIFQSLLS
jgi:phosphoribosylformylglycinamidine synthase